MKLFTLLFTTFFASASFAADPSSFASAGCDTATLVPVTNAAGEVLYWTNTDGGGCKADRGNFGADVKAALAKKD